MIGAPLQCRRRGAAAVRFLMPPQAPPSPSAPSSSFVAQVQKALLLDDHARHVPMAAQHGSASVDLRRLAAQSLNLSRILLESRSNKPRLGLSRNLWPGSVLYGSDPFASAGAELGDCESELDTFRAGMEAPEGHGLLSDMSWMQQTLICSDDPLADIETMIRGSRDDRGGKGNPAHSLFLSPPPWWPSVLQAAADSACPPSQNDGRNLPSAMPKEIDSSLLAHITRAMSHRVKDAAACDIGQPEATAATSSAIPGGTSDPFKRLTDLPGCDVYWTAFLWLCYHGALSRFGDETVGMAAPVGWMSLDDALLLCWRRLNRHCLALSDRQRGGGSIRGGIQGRTGSPLSECMDSMLFILRTMFERIARRSRCTSDDQCREVMVVARQQPTQHHQLSYMLHRTLTWLKHATHVSASLYALEPLLDAIEIEFQRRPGGQPNHAAAADQRVAAEGFVSLATPSFAITALSRITDRHHGEAIYGEVGDTLGSASVDSTPRPTTFYSAWLVHWLRRQGCTDESLSAMATRQVRRLCHLNVCAAHACRIAFPADYLDVVANITEKIDVAASAAAARPDASMSQQSTAEGSQAPPLPGDSGHRDLLSSGLRLLMGAEEPRKLILRVVAGMRLGAKLLHRRCDFNFLVKLIFLRPKYTVTAPGAMSPGDYPLLGAWIPSFAAVDGFFSPTKSGPTTSWSPTTTDTGTRTLSDDSAALYFPLDDSVFLRLHEAHRESRVEDPSVTARTSGSSATSELMGPSWHVAHACRRATDVSGVVLGMHEASRFMIATRKAFPTGYPAHIQAALADCIEAYGNQVFRLSLRCGEPTSGAVLPIRREFEQSWLSRQGYLDLFMGTRPEGADATPGGSSQTASQGDMPINSATLLVSLAAHLLFQVMHLWRRPCSLPPSVALHHFLTGVMGPVSGSRRRRVATSTLASSSVDEAPAECSERVRAFAIVTFGLVRITEDKRFRLSASSWLTELILGDTEAGGALRLMRKTVEQALHMALTCDLVEGGDPCGDSRALPAGRPRDQFLLHPSPPVVGSNNISSRVQSSLLDAGSSPSHMKDMLWIVTMWNGSRNLWGRLALSLLVSQGRVVDAAALLMRGHGGQQGSDAIGNAGVSQGEPRVAAGVQLPLALLYDFDRAICQTLRNAATGTSGPDLGPEQWSQLRDAQSVVKLHIALAFDDGRECTQPWTCPGCRGLNAASSSTCRQCGAMPQMLRHCQRCSALTTGVLVAAPLAEGGSEDSWRCAVCLERLPEDCPVVVRKPWRCRRCRFSNPAGNALFCGQCFSEPPGLPRVSKPITCSTCGLVNGEGMARPWCQQCGTLAPLVATAPPPQPRPHEDSEASSPPRSGSRLPGGSIRPGSRHASPSLTHTTSDGRRWTGSVLPHLWECHSCGTWTPWVAAACGACKSPRWSLAQREGEGEDTVGDSERVCSSNDSPGWIPWHSQTCPRCGDGTQNAPTRSSCWRCDAPLFSGTAISVSPLQSDFLSLAQDGFRFVSGRSPESSANDSTPRESTTAESSVEWLGNRRHAAADPADAHEDVRVTAPPDRRSCAACGVMDCCLPRTSDAAAGDAVSPEEGSTEKEEESSVPPPWVCLTCGHDNDAAEVRSWNPHGDAATARGAEQTASRPTSSKAVSSSSLSLSAAPRTTIRSTTRSFVRPWYLPASYPPVAVRRVRHHEEAALNPALHVNEEEEVVKVKEELWDSYWLCVARGCLAVNRLRPSAVDRDVAVICDRCGMSGTLASRANALAAFVILRSQLPQQDAGGARVQGHEAGSSSTGTAAAPPPAIVLLDARPFQCGGCGVRQDARNIAGLCVLCGRFTMPQCQLDATLPDDALTKHGGGSVASPPPASVTLMVNEATSKHSPTDVVRAVLGWASLKAAVSFLTHLYHDCHAATISAANTAGTPPQLAKDRAQLGVVVAQQLCVHLQALSALASERCQDDTRILPWQTLDLVRGVFAEAPDTPAHRDGTPHTAVSAVERVIRLLCALHSLTASSPPPTSLVTTTSEHRASTGEEEGEGPVIGGVPPLLEAALLLVELVNQSTQFDELGFGCLEQLALCLRPTAATTIRSEMKWRYLTNMKLTPGELRGS